MFLLVVRHFRWLAGVPLFPQIFDGLLLAWTCLVHRPRLAAMEMLEARALTLPGVSLHVHRLGGLAFICGGEELGHMHGHGLLDVRLSPRHAASCLAAGGVHAHHVFPPASGWISFPLETPADVPRALDLLRQAAARTGTHLPA